MQEMTITSVHALGPRYAVILKEKDADRYLPILVGASDANAIAIKLHNPQVSLNLTHDLLCTVIDALGGSVRQVLINRDCPDQTDSSATGYVQGCRRNAQRPSRCCKAGLCRYTSHVLHRTAATP